MGRSRNTALILVSQNAGDLLNEQVTNCISGVFAFRSSERAEVASVMALLGVEPSDEHKAVLRGLGNGECIFRDLDGRAGRVGIDLISDDLRRSLDTNPTRARPGEVPVTAHEDEPAAPPRRARSEEPGSGSAEPPSRPGDRPPHPGEHSPQPAQRSRGGQPAEQAHGVPQARRGIPEGRPAGAPHPPVPEAHRGVPGGRRPPGPTQSSG